MSAARTQLKMNPAAKTMDGVRKQASSPADTTQKKQPAPKAWTGGTNPITQKSASANAPNGVAGAPRHTASPKPTQPQTKGPSSSEKQANDRLLFMLANFTGLMTTLTTKNGDQFTGVFAGASVDSADPHYVLKMVKRSQAVSNATNGTTSPVDEYLGIGEDHVLTLPTADVVDLAVSDVVLDKSAHKTQNGVASSSFRTDSDITGTAAARERNLQRWEPGVGSSTDLSLDDSNSTGWNQFEANERLYGVTTSYDENLYTTSIDRSDPKYSQMAAKAEKLAREIEGSNAMNSHVAEERGGRNVDDAGLDEEDKYSGVRRDFPPLQSGQPNKYTPPARRAPTGQATVPGAPVDPAIISSQLSKPSPTGTSAEPQSAAAIIEQVPKTSAPVPQQVETKQPVNENAKSIATAPATLKDAPTASEQKPAQSSASKPSLQTTPARQYGQGQNATANVERDLLISFKEFSATEKMKVHERNRAQRSNDKAVKLNDLKKFSQNFKLCTPVPTDLVPILAKDKNKQNEIVEKAARQAREQEARKASAVSSEAITADQKTTRAPPAGTSSPNAASERPNDRAKQPQNFNSQSTRGNKMQPYGMQPSREGRQPGLAQRLQMNQPQHKGAGVMSIMPPPLALQDMRIPSGPSSSGTPSSASLRAGAKPFEFRPNPAASTFTPVHPSASTSPRMDGMPIPQPKPSKAGSFFGGKKPPSRSERPSINDMFNPVKRMKKETEENGKTKDFASNGGIPNAFRTPPTWDVPPENQEKRYVEMFEKAPAPAPSPMHNSPVNVPMAHQHQLPLHLQQNAPGMPSAHTPQQTPRNFSAQPNMVPGGPHFDDHRMQFSQSQSSVQPSPRFGQPMLAYPNMQPQMQQAYGQPMHAPYGMSPGSHHVQYRAAPQPPFVHPQGAPMGGQMMVQQPSGGPFVSGMPGMPMFAPVPANPQQHYGGPPPPGGYPSPRPAPMSHQGSQQGHGPPQPVIYMQAPQHGGPPPMMYPQHPGAMTPMRGYPPQPHYAPSPHQQHQFTMAQHRNAPGTNFHHMGTPHATPQQGPPPVMATGTMAGHGDENK
ncbi:MAG: hypothetical protein M1821_006073 [Bathelium mastoideum]|nr:MAG: hypothetical protein M1821_006073 [Bathelium mastoideum]KAI9688395.1 MAG: hypothetical protein M1822_001344 [Bathelium mastoideum]